MNGVVQGLRGGGSGEMMVKRYKVSVSDNEFWRAKYSMVPLANNMYWIRKICQSIHFFKDYFYWCIVALQYCVIFCCIAK